MLHNKLLLIVTLAGFIQISLQASSTTVTKFTKVQVSLPHGQRGEKVDLGLRIPTTGEQAIADPETLFSKVKKTWKAVVEKNQAGLVEPKREGQALAPLSPEEAWHHWNAGQEGVIDSARLLLAFGLVPALQSGGHRIHLAAATGDLALLQRVLEDDENVVDIDTPKEQDGTTALHTAVTVGNLEVAEYLLAAGANVEAVGKNGITPLMIASTLGHVDILRVIISYEADLNRAHPFAGSTALHFAAEMGQIQIIEVLCALGVDVNAQKKNGGTALHSAADANQTEAVKVLLTDCNADPTLLLMKDTTPLYLAAQRGFTEVCKILIDVGKVDVNYAMPRGHYTSHVAIADERSGSKQWYPQKNTEIGNGATALHAAVENGHFFTAKLLLSRNAKQLGSMEGATPLITALQYRQEKIAKLLFENGRDVRINAQVPIDGVYALYVAAGYGYESVVKKILKYEIEQPNLNLRTRKGQTALSYAVSRRNSKIVSLLLEAGCKIGASNPSALSQAAQLGDRKILRKILKSAAKQNLDEFKEDELTPLHSAASVCNTGVLLELLRFFNSSSDINRGVKSTGATPLMIAARGGHLDCVDLMIKAGAFVNIKAKSNPFYGATALYLAAQNNHLDVVKFLLSHGADPDLTLDELHVTPLFIAAERGHLEVLMYLVENANANYQLKNVNNLSPFEIACITGQIKTCQYLYDLADVNQRQGTLKTLLSKRSDLRCLDIFLNGKTPVSLLHLKVVLVAQQHKSTAWSHDQAKHIIESIFYRLGAGETSPADYKALLALAVKTYDFESHSTKDRRASEIVSQIVSSFINEDDTDSADICLDYEEPDLLVEEPVIIATTKDLPLTLKALLTSEKTSRCVVEKAHDIAIQVRSFKLIKLLSSSLGK